MTIFFSYFITRIVKVNLPLQIDITFKRITFRPLSSLDVRGVSLSKGIHWSSPDIFGPRARFNIDAGVPALEIEVNNSLSNKGSIYSN